MQEKDIKNAYITTADFKKAVADILDSLDENAPVVFAKRRKRIRFSIVFALIFLILSTTVVGAYTEFFGLFSERVGNYGLNITVETQAVKETKTSDTGVTLDLGYLPDGYKEPYGDDIAKDVYEYYSEDENDLRLTFFVTKKEDFIFQEKFITDYTETEFDGYKTVFATQKIEVDSDEYYLSVKYFDDWGYVVTCYCEDYDELKKVTEHLNLKKAAKIADDTNKKTAPTNGTEDYSYRRYEEYSILKTGESLDVSRIIMNGENQSDFTVKVKSVEERKEFSGLDRTCLLYDELYSQFFDDNGSLITPYTRRDMSGDGVNSLIDWSETIDDRNFYIVTLDVTANTEERTEFNTSCISASKVDVRDESNITVSEKRGDFALIYMEPDNSSNVTVDIPKGETVTFTVGIVADDDIKDNACLTIENHYIDINHQNESVVDRFGYTCVMLNSEVDYD